MASTVACGSARSTGEKAIAFALVGDRYHNSDYIRSALGKTLVREAGLSIDFSDEYRLLNADTLRERRLLIVFRSGTVWPEGYPPEAWLHGYETRGPGNGDIELQEAWYPGYKMPKPPQIVSDPPLPECLAKPVGWITPEQGVAVKEFVRNSGSVLFYHNATHIAKYDQNVRDTLGAVMLGHPPVRPYRVRIVQPNHPITTGVRDFVVTDEQHFMTYEKDSTHVLLRSENEDGLTFREHGTSCEAGWAYEYGQGRVCYLAPGHMISALWNPEYAKIQENAVRWLLREI